MGSEFDEFTFPVLIAGYSYAVHADTQTLRTIPATLAKSTMFHGLWFIDGEGKARRIKETICTTTEHRRWNPFRLRDVPIQFVFEDDTVVFTVGEVKSLLFDGLARVPDHAGYDLAELKMRLEPAQSLCELFRILSEKQEAIRSTLILCSSMSPPSRNRLWNLVLGAPAGQRPSPPFIDSLQADAAGQAVAG